jgi:hypothetical protein
MLCGKITNFFQVKVVPIVKSAFFKPLLLSGLAAVSISGFFCSKENTAALQANTGNFASASGSFEAAISITSPLADAAYFRNDSILLSASVSGTDTGTDNNIWCVNFYVNSDLVSVDSVPPYSCIYQDSVAGQKSLFAAAINFLNDTAYSSEVIFSISDGFIELTSPVNNGVYPLAKTIAIKAAPQNTDYHTVKTVKFYRNTTLLYTDNYTPFAYNWTNPAAGVYSIKAVAVDTRGKSDTSNIAVVTVKNILPSVTLTSPVNDTLLKVGSTLTLSATASDSDDTVASVKFYKGTTLIYSDLAAPFTYIWKSIPAGVYSVKAIVTDNNGGKDTSDMVTVTVRNKIPKVALTSPVNGSSYKVGSTVILTAAASDSDGTITSVKFYKGTTLLYTDLAAPYTYSWKYSVAGVYNLKAIVTDNNNGKDTSEIVSVTFNKNNPPVVSITSPVNGSNLRIGSTVAVTAAASDSDGAVTCVKFYRDGAFVFTDSTAPYSWNWVNAAAGVHTFHAIAYDNNKVYTKSATISATMVPKATSLALSSPSAGQTFYAADTISISAVATDFDTAPVVIFYIDSIEVMRDSAAPYILTETGRNFTVGSHTVKAEAVETGITYKAASSFIIAASSPLVEITSPADSSWWGGVCKTCISDVPVSVDVVAPLNDITRVIFTYTYINYDPEAEPVELAIDSTAPYECVFNIKQWPWGMGTLKVFAESKTAPAAMDSVILFRKIDIK